MKTRERLLFRFTKNTEKWDGFFRGVLGTAGKKAWLSVRRSAGAVPCGESILHDCQRRGRSIIRADANHPPCSRYG